MKKLARYNLLFKDQVYGELIKICNSRKISMGRLLNDIINDYAKNNSDNPDLFKTYLCKYPTVKNKMRRCSYSHCPLMFDNEAHYEKEKDNCKYYS